MRHHINGKNFKIEIPSYELGIPNAKIELPDGTIVTGKVLQYIDSDGNPFHLGANVIFTKNTLKNQIHTLVTINFGKVPGNILSLTSRVPTKIQTDSYKRLYIYFVEVGKSFMDGMGNAMQTWLDLVYSKKKSINREEYESLDYENDFWSSMVSTPFYKLIKSVSNPFEHSSSKQITNVKNELAHWLNQNNAPDLKEEPDANKLPENTGIDI